MPGLIKNVDYYVNEEGYVVLTAKYLRDRGYCCGNGCLNCPYNYENVREPKKSELMKKREERGGTIK